MNKIITTAIAACAVLAASTAYGAGVTSSKGVNLIGGTINNSGDFLSVLVFFDQRFLDSSYIYVNGVISGQYFTCSGTGSTVANMIDVTPPASKSSVQANTSQLLCSGAGTLPVRVTMNCLENGQFSNSAITNGSSTYNGTNYIYHGNFNSSDAYCTGTADQVNFDISQYGSLTYNQYVNNTN